MARYEHLPIYKKAIYLTIYFVKGVRNFHHYHKYSLSIRNLQSTPEDPIKEVGAMLNEHGGFLCSPLPINSNGLLSKSSFGAGAYK